MLLEQHEKTNAHAFALEAQGLGAGNAYWELIWVTRTQHECVESLVSPPPSRGSSMWGLHGVGSVASQDSASTTWNTCNAGNVGSGGRQRSSTGARDWRQVAIAAGQDWARLSRLESQVKVVLDVQ